MGFRDIQGLLSKSVLFLARILFHHLPQCFKAKLRKLARYSYSNIRSHWSSSC